MLPTYSDTKYTFPFQNGGRERAFAVGEPGYRV